MSVYLPPALATDAKRWKRAQQRGGIHKRVAMVLDSVLTGVLEEWQDWAAGQVYAMPSNEDRNAWAAEFDTSADHGTMIWTTLAFQYILWNRKVTVIAELRRAHFDIYKAALEPDGDAAATSTDV